MNILILINLLCLIPLAASGAVRNKASCVSPFFLDQPFPFSSTHAVAQKSRAASSTARTVSTAPSIVKTSSAVVTSIQKTSSITSAGSALTTAASKPSSMSPSVDRILTVSGPSQMASSTAVVSSSTQNATAGASSSSEIVVPLYIYPSTGAWKFLFDAVSASPSVTWRVIINPNSGPSGNPPDSDYVSAIKTLKTYSNVKLIGYVHVGYATRAYAESAADVQTYSQWPSAIAVQGYFFDESPYTDDAGQVAYMSKLTAYARSKIPNGHIMLNPGTDTLAAYWPLADSICIYEKSYQSYTTQPPVVPNGISPAQVVAIIHSGPDSLDLQNAMVDDLVGKRKLGSIFVTTSVNYQAAPPLLTQLGTRTSLAISK